MRERAGEIVDVRERLRQQHLTWNKTLDRTETAAHHAVEIVRDDRAQRAKDAHDFTTLVERTAAVVDDMQNLRKSDEWSIAFGMLANLTLANLAVALQRAEPEVAGGLLLNLRSLLDALQEKFPDGRIPLTQWQVAIEAFGPGTSAPDFQKEQHPFVDTLAKQVRTVRDRGLALSGFREFYVLAGAKLHVVRPS